MLQFCQERGLTFTWTFQEAGHGKGAPDGIGALLKRTADHFVSSTQRSITNAKDLLSAAGNLNINLGEIAAEDIEEHIEQLAQVSHGLKSVTAMMKAHQVHFNGEIIVFRNLSCTCPNLCQCFGARQWIPNASPCSNVQSTVMAVVPPVTLPTRNTAQSPMTVGSWVVNKLDLKGRSRQATVSKLFFGQVVETAGDTVCLRYVEGELIPGKTFYSLPEVEDLDGGVPISGCFAVMQPTNSQNPRTRKFGYEFDASDVLNAQKVLMLD